MSVTSVSASGVFESTLLDVASIDTNPKNARASISPKDVAGLADSIRLHGLLQPIVVAEEENGRHLLLAGHRRLAAFKSLGHDSIPARILEGGAAKSVQILVVENEQREDLDPVRESELVSQLLEQDGWTSADVANTLGRSTSWVARRAQLSNLSKVARKERGDGGCLASWPASWLEEVAMLSPAKQDELLAEWTNAWARPNDLDEVRRTVRTFMAELSSAPWDLADAALDRKAGACTSCTKHSAASPGLFEDRKDASDIKTGICRDVGCFDRKRVAHMKIRTDLAREKYGENLIVLTEHGQSEEIAKATGVRAMSYYQAEKVKKTDPGARPALVLEGDKAGSVQWIKDPEAKRGRNGASTSSEVVAAPQKKTLVEKRIGLEKRRLAHAVNGLVEELKTFADRLSPCSIVADDAQLLELLGAFGCASVARHEMQMQVGSARSKKSPEVYDWRITSSMAGHARRAELSTRAIEEMLSYQGALGKATRDMKPEEAVSEARALLTILRWDGEKGWEARVKKAKDAIPEPTSWKKEAEAERNEAADTKRRNLAAKRATKSKSGKDAASGERD